MTTPIPLLDAMLADPRRAEAPLGDGPARARTGFAVASFIAGLRCFDADPQTTRARVQALASDAQLFAWEGVGLAAEAHGQLAPVLAAERASAPLLWVGAGWADALRGRPITTPRGDHVDRWSMLDGHGFCLGLLDRRSALLEFLQRDVDRNVELALDQGLGRSLYFVHGGSPSAIARAITDAPARRQCALWSGVGVASVITNGLDDDARAQLRAHGGVHLHLGEQLAALLTARIQPRVPNSGPNSAETDLLDGSQPPLAILRRGMTRRS